MTHFKLDRICLSKFVHCMIHTLEPRHIIAGGRVFMCIRVEMLY